ncbi:hypothetical protein GCM10018780_41630 [Streptomyces lanatus]|nr:hypothetical protein GCM10018780_41630 [Streptomyces lanatus]
MAASQAARNGFSTHEAGIPREHTRIVEKCFPGQTPYDRHLRRSQPRPEKPPEAGAAGSNPAGGTMHYVADLGFLPRSAFHSASDSSSGAVCVHRATLPLAMRTSGMWRRPSKHSKR